jgi:uncharacterized delta-60 repeat protein
MGVEFPEYIFDLEVLTNGQILAFGRFNQVQGVPRNNLARLNADGSIDSRFDSDSSQGGLNGVVYAYALQPDGRIVIGGEFTAVGSVTRNRVARLNTNGSHDTTFDPGAGPGGLPYTEVSTTAVQPGGGILVGGWFSTFGDAPHERIVRLNFDGTVDHDFKASVHNYLNDLARVLSIAVLPNGKILLAGQGFNLVGGSPRVGIARLNSDGSLDPGFDARLHGFTNFKALVPLPDGSVYLAGNLVFADGGGGWAARFDEDGSRDFAFDVRLPTGEGLNELAVQPDGPVLISGLFTAVDGVPCAGLARLFPEAPALTQVDVVESRIQVNEPHGRASVQLQRHGDTSLPLTVSVVTTDGSAIAGEDYTGLSAAVTFAPLETAKTVSIRILDDTNLEDAETFAFLVATVPDGVLTGRTECAIQIQEDDADPPQLRLEARRVGSTLHLIATGTTDTQWRLESRDSASGTNNWQPLTNLTLSTGSLILDQPVTPISRFYRGAWVP